MTGQHPPGHQYQAAPGWYADPSGAAWLRYFDGYRWTNHVHPAAENHRPQAAAVVRPNPHDEPQAASATPDPDPAPDVPDVDGMSGVEFENYVASLYRSRGFEAEVTRASGDFGADLIVAAKGGLRRSEWDPKSYDSDGWSNRMAVQCKRYSGAVGVSAVMAIIAGKGMYDCARTALVTNSTFTAQARELRQLYNVAADTPNSAATCSPDLPSAASSSARRSLRTMSSAECRLRPDMCFIVPSSPSSGHETLKPAGLIHRGHAMWDSPQFATDFVSNISNRFSHGLREAMR
jgi:hypothetical protein